MVDKANSLITLEKDNRQYINLVSKGVMERGPSDESHVNLSTDNLMDKDPVRRRGLLWNMMR